MASFREKLIKGASQTTNMRQEISVKKDFHVPPLTATMKESKKKRKDKTKEKKKSRNCINQTKDSGELVLKLVNALPYLVIDAINKVS